MPTARSAPVGTMLENGYQSLVAFADDPDISFWEKSVQPPGLDGGEKIDITTMHNTSVKTYAPQALSGMTDGDMTVAYDPVVLSQIIALINVSNAVTNHFSDGSSWDGFGYLQTFTPNAMSNGEQPEATCTVVYTNVDPADGSESSPSYTAPTP